MAGCVAQSGWLLRGASCYLPFSLHHCGRAGMSEPVGHGVTQFQFVQAVPSNRHSPDKKLCSAEPTCVDQRVPHSGARIAEYPARYGWDFCAHTAVVLVPKLQEANNYRTFSATCLSGLPQNDWNELDVGTYCGKHPRGILSSRSFGRC